MSDSPVVHFEIGCSDGPGTREFFSKLFGWSIAGPDGGFAIDTGGESAIAGHIAELAPEWGIYVTIYIKVEDLAGSLTKATGLGGKVLVEPVEVPGQGSFAWLAAPEGNIVGIWKPESA